MFENIRPRQHPHTKLWGLIYDHDYGDSSPAIMWIVQPYYEEREFIILMAKMREASFTMGIE